jgi:UDP-N-acetylglucosamine transferase subunit ALG13
MEVLSRGKPLISVSNPDRYDQHQQDLLKTLSDQNYLIWCRDLEGLAEAIQQAKHMSFKRYVKPTCTIHTQIQTFLSQTIELDDS